jgi:hypothetical protein
MNKQLGYLVLMTALCAACTQESQPPASGEPAAAGQAQPAAPGGAASQLGPAGRAASSAPADARAAAPAAAAVGTPPPPPKPQFKEVTLPKGTSLSVSLDTTVASDTSKIEDAVRGKLAKPIVIDGTTAVPAGALVAGTVTEAVRAGKVKGRASIAIRFTSLTAHDEKHEIATARIARQAASTKGDDAKKIGIGAGAGALIGAIAGGGKGAAIGGAVGAGAGTGVVMATRGDEVELAAGATVTTTLQEPIKVLVPIE